MGVDTSGESSRGSPLAGFEPRYFFLLSLPRASARGAQVKLPCDDRLRFVRNLVRHFSLAPLATVIAASCVVAAIDRPAPVTVAVTATDEAVERRAEIEIGSRLPISIAPGIRPFSALPALAIVNGNGGATCSVRPYREDGALDDAALATIDATLADVRDPAHPEIAALDRRLVRVLARAAYHFDATTVRVVSAYRAPRRRAEGLHAKGRAIDFSLDGVPPRELAAYLREHPRVGVGVYVHPRTQYVHLDVREQSFHWIDGSPPRTSGWPASLGTRGLEALDATWSEDADAPEHTR